MQKMQDEKLAKLWEEEEAKIHSLKTTDAKAFARPAVPLARVKKVMKLDEDVHMISEQSPRFLAKAVEVGLGGERSVGGCVGGYEVERALRLALPRRPALPVSAPAICSCTCTCNVNPSLAGPVPISR